ncbi:hypothetical protein [Zoogloea sp.]|jgi:hypothetical protein|nr:hypothetical protein [Zoogloea sp.]HPI62339.1 hypothetical protein [Zoogloea sp.]
MASAPPILSRPAPATPVRPADLPTPVLRHGSPPAQRTLPLRRAA